MIWNTAEFPVPRAPRLEPTLWFRRRNRGGERPPRPAQPDLMAEARGLVLEHVRRQGESRVAALPRAWPVTREMVRRAARELAEAGVLEPVRSPESGQVLGYRAVAE